MNRELPGSTAVRAKQQGEQDSQELQVEECVDIGGSPLPGITLRQVLRGHEPGITRIAWSPDGRYLASPSRDKTIRIWDIENQKCKILEGHLGGVLGVTWHPNRPLLASFGDYNDPLRFWDPHAGTPVKIIFDLPDAIPSIYGGSFFSDGSMLAIGSGVLNLNIGKWINLDLKLVPSCIS
jgi:WD40 repeat protein